MEHSQVYVSLQALRDGTFHGLTLTSMKPWCVAICCLALLPGHQHTFQHHLLLRTTNFNPWKPSIAIASAPSQPFIPISAMLPYTSQPTSIPSTPTSPKQFGATFGVLRTSPPSPTHLQLEYLPGGFISSPMRRFTLFKPDFTTFLLLPRKKIFTEYP